MSIEQYRAKVKSGVWQAFAQSGVDLKSIPSEQQNKLADTITDFNAETGQGNGFTFRDYTPVTLFGAISRALLTMRVSQARSRLLRNAMSCDFSWHRSARAYAALYERAIARHTSQPAGRLGG